MSVAQSVPFPHSSRIRGIGVFMRAILLVLQQLINNLYATPTAIEVL